MSLVGAAHISLTVRRDLRSSVDTPAQQEPLITTWGEGPRSHQ